MSADEEPLTSDENDRFVAAVSDELDRLDALYPDGPPLRRPVRRTLWRHRGQRCSWHVFRPGAPTRVGCRLVRRPNRFSWSCRWVMGWVLW